MERVSVIIPTYNRENTIKRSIKSVLEQSYSNIELIVVDDASKDDTMQIVESIEDPRIIYIKLDKNVGAAGARNAGVKNSASEYIAFNDSDDEWLNDKLLKQMDYMIKNPDIDLVYCGMEICEPDKSFTFPNDTVSGELEGYIYKWLLRRNTIGTPSMLVKKRCFDEIGGFDSALRCLEDWEMAVRFSKEHKIGFVDDALVRVYSQKGGVSYNIGAYYETRCKMIADNKDQMVELGIFDEIVIDMFDRAKTTGVLEQVKTMLMGYLT